MDEGHTVRLSPIGPVEVADRSDLQYVSKACDNKLPRSGTHIRIWHQHDMQFEDYADCKIGFPIFELDKFTSFEKLNLNKCDKLFVCSQWAKNVVQENNIDVETHVVPLGVDMSIFKPTPKDKGRKTVFLNCGKWEIRKGHDVLITAFKDAYKENNNIELWIMPSNPFNSQKDNFRWRSLCDHPAIKVLPRAKTHHDVYNIMAKADCGVFPSRAEGWNLELLEMMSIGRPVIATDYSAHTEFCNDDNCHLIPVKRLEPAFDNKWFFGQGNWGHIDEKAYSKLIRAILIAAEPSQGSFSEACVKTAERFSWRESARRIARFC